MRSCVCQSFSVGNVLDQIQEFAWHIATGAGVVLLLAHTIQQGASGDGEGRKRMEE